MAACTTEELACFADRAAQADAVGKGPMDSRGLHPSTGPAAEDAVLLSPLQQIHAQVEYGVSFPSSFGGASSPPRTRVGAVAVAQRRAQCRASAKSRKLGSTIFKIKKERQKAQLSADPLTLELTKELATAEAESSKAGRMSAAATGYPADPPKVNRNKFDAYSFAWTQANSNGLRAKKPAVLRRVRDGRPIYEHFWYQERIGEVFGDLRENGAKDLTYGDAFIQSREADEQPASERVPPDDFVHLGEPPPQVKRGRGRLRSGQECASADPARPPAQAVCWSRILRQPEKEIPARTSDRDRYCVYDGPPLTRAQAAAEPAADARPPRLFQPPRRPAAPAGAVPRRSPVPAGGSR